MPFYLFLLFFSLESFSLFATKTPIMGSSICKAEQMNRFLFHQNPKCDPKYRTLANIFLTEGAKEGVRGDIAFAQSLHETNFFKFTGDVQPGQNNFSGIGTFHGQKGHRFKTPQEGIQAQIQHLKAYACKRPLNCKCVDPRFRKVKRGSAIHFEDLSGKWAYPGYDTKRYKSLHMALRKKDTYGHKIVNLYNKMKRF